MGLLFLVFPRFSCAVHLSVCALMYIHVSAEPSSAPVSSSSVARPEQGLICLSLERICAILTSCHCLLQFLTSILLSAFSPSIIHGWVQTFVFCLNNWSKAWSEEGECICSSKKKKGGVNEKSSGHSSLFPILSFSKTLRGSLQYARLIKNSFLTFSSAHLSPHKVDLAPSSYTLSPSTAPPLTLTLK